MHRLILPFYLVAILVNESTLLGRHLTLPVAAPIALVETVNSPAGWVAAVEANPAMSQKVDETESLRTGSSLFPLVLASIVAILFFFRGREIRRQHPRSFR